ncbi:MAG TPA: cellulase N-terminal Ig-like domain-containing protein, partial [Polyangiaceae bacterium]|nr:cellulase N-terminal Ig-like domain-containing protein [Polyangiaceae bacterium]
MGGHLRLASFALALVGVASCGHGSSGPSDAPADGGALDGAPGDAPHGSPDGGADGGSEGGTTASYGAATLPAGYPNLDLPPVGAAGLRVVTPTLLELSLVTTKAADPAPLTEWTFVDASGTPSALPAASNFVVHAGASTVAVQQVGFKRRPVYAPLARYDLRVGNWLYLVLASPLSDGAAVTVDDASGQLWTSPSPYATTVDPMRFGPALHVNQTGYVPSLPKHAFVGYYEGSLGELTAPATTFTLVDRATGKTAFQGTLAARLDSGFPFQPAQYQQVLDADFSAFQTPGQYQLVVPGMGASYPFLVDDGVAMAFARTYAQGMYNQRCGMAKALPFTRFPDGADHTAPVSVPTADAAYMTAQQLLASNAQVPQGQTAPELTSFTNGLYPYAAAGPLDETG